jgi:hypothetical protein
MLYLIKEPSDRLLSHISEDPVRPHIPITARLGTNRDIFTLVQDDQVKAITCVSYNPQVPESEQDLFSLDHPLVAVFYTIWSYENGAGRALLLDAVNYIQSNRGDIQRFVTLSPKTEMARRFHIKNGAIVLRENQSTVNYEYQRA